MQLPKQFKSWVQFAKHLDRYHNKQIVNFAYPEPGEPDHFEVCEVRHMALKELLAAMPDNRNTLYELMQFVRTDSDEFKMLDKLDDILY